MNIKRGAKPKCIPPPNALELTTIVLCFVAIEITAGGVFVTVSSAFVSFFFKFGMGSFDDKLLGAISQVPTDGFNFQLACVVGFSWSFCDTGFVYSHVPTDGSFVHCGSVALTGAADGADLALMVARAGPWNFFQMLSIFIVRMFWV